MCLKNFNSHDKNLRKVRNHCHFSSKYYRATHSICNIRYSVPREIPVGFQNESNYDFSIMI